MTDTPMAVLLSIRDRFARDLAVEVLREGGLTPVLPVVDESPQAAVRRTAATVVVLDVVGSDPVDRLEGTLVDVLASGARILLVADGALRHQVLAGLLAGASGQVALVGTAPRRLVQAVRQVAEGSAALHPDVAAAVLQQWRATRGTGKPRRDDVALSAREVEILSHAATGLTNQAIARRLDVSLKTVETHKARLFAKLGARNQAQAVSLAIQRGLLKEQGAGGPAGTP